jgi:hypothetical protein
VERLLAQNRDWEEINFGESDQQAAEEPETYTEISTGHCGRELEELIENETLGRC